MDTAIKNMNEEQKDLEKLGSLEFSYGHYGGYDPNGYSRYYRSPFLGYGFIGPFATGLLGGLAVNALFSGYGGYGYGGAYPYYGSYAYPPPYYYGGYGYPYWRYY